MRCRARVAANASAKKKLAARLEKQKIVGVRRQGLYLLFDLDADDVLVVHLGSGGGLLRAPTKEPMPDDAILVITFTQQGQLRMTDAAGEATVQVVPADELVETIPALAAIGVDPIEEPMSWVTFGELLLAHDMKLRTLLTDDTIITGLGDVYADEILFNAGLRYDRSTASLSTQEIRRLYRAVVETLHESAEAPRRHASGRGVPGRLRGSREPSRST